MKVLRSRLLEQKIAEEHAKYAAERKSQIGTGERSEKIRVYRYQDGIVADQRLSEKFQLREVLEGKLSTLMEALIEQQTAARLAEL